MSLQMAHQTLPVSLKSLSVDASGKLSRRRAVGPLDFTFRHGDRTFACRFTERGPRAVVSMTAALGDLGAAPAETRRAVRRVVRAARTAGVGLIIRRDGRLELAEKIRPAPPVEAHVLVGGLTTVVLRAAPWMALAEDVLSGRAP